MSNENLMSYLNLVLDLPANYTPNFIQKLKVLINKIMTLHEMATTITFDLSENNLRKIKNIYDIIVNDLSITFLSNTTILLGIVGFCCFLSNENSFYILQVLLKIGNFLVVDVWYNSVKYIILTLISMLYKFNPTTAFLNELDSFTLILPKLMNSFLNFVTSTTQNIFGGHLEILWSFFSQHFNIVFTTVSSFLNSSMNYTDKFLYLFLFIFLGVFQLIKSSAKMLLQYRIVVIFFCVLIAIYVCKNIFGKQTIKENLTNNQSPIINSPITNNSLKEENINNNDDKINLKF